MRHSDMKHNTNFNFRINIWDDVGGEIFEHMVGVDDFEMAISAYEAAAKR